MFLIFFVLYLLNTINISCRNFYWIIRTFMWLDSMWTQRIAEIFIPKFMTFNYLSYKTGTKYSDPYYSLLPTILVKRQAYPSKIFNNNKKNLNEAQCENCKWKADWLKLVKNLYEHLSECRKLHWDNKSFVFDSIFRPICIHLHVAPSFSTKVESKKNITSTS